MASRYTVDDPSACWKDLMYALSLGHTVPFIYKKSPQEYLLLSSDWTYPTYRDVSCSEYLLDDIQFALFDEGLKEVRLRLSGLADGPVCDSYEFTFTKEGLVKAYSYYNDD